MSSVGERRHILIVAPWSPHGVAGAERIIITLANGLTSEYRVTVIAIAPGAVARPETLSENVDFSTYNVPHARASIGRLASDLRAIQPDVIISNVAHISTNVTLALWRARRRIPHVCVNHGMDAAHTMDRVHTIFSYLFCTEYVVVSAGLASLVQRYLRWLRPRLTVIHNGLDIAHIQAQGKVPLQPEHIVWSSDRLTIVAVGRLVPQKSFAVLLRAVAELVRAKKYPVNLLLVGDGELRTELTQLTTELNITEYVHWLGWQHNPYQYMAAADVFVLSSYFEGFGNVLVEALALGVPVVSTDCPSGPSEILAGGEYGQLVPVGDSAALALAIKETLAEKSDSERLKKRAEDFSDDKMVGEYKLVIESLL